MGRVDPIDLKEGSMADELRNKDDDDTELARSYRKLEAAEAAIVEAVRKRDAALTSFREVCGRVVGKKA